MTIQIPKQSPFVIAYDPVVLQVKQAPTTGGGYDTEDEAKTHFATLISASGLFDVEREVEAIPIDVVEKKNKEWGYIDFVMFPTESALTGGWTLGPIGVEVKREGESAGEALAQTWDYRQSWMRCKTRPATRISMAFLFHYKPSPCPELLSLMQQHRCGGAYLRDEQLMFMCGGSRVMRIGTDKSFEFFDVPYGKKRYRR